MGIFFRPPLGMLSSPKNLHLFLPIAWRALHYPPTSTLNYIYCLQFSEKNNDVRVIKSRNDYFPSIHSQVQNRKVGWISFLVHSFSESVALSWSVLCGGFNPASMPFAGARLCRPYLRVFPSNQSSRSPGVRRYHIQLAWPPSSWLERVPLLSGRLTYAIERVRFYFNIFKGWVAGEF